MRTPRSPHGSESGFTLIELLVAMTVSGIILAALATGFISALRGTAGAHDRMVNSNGNHTLATYFTADVQSANPDMVSTDPSAGTGCDDSTLPANTTNLVRMQWYEYTTATEVTAFSASYRILWTDDGDAVQELTSENSPGGSSDQYQLIRYACSVAQDPFTGDVAALLAGATFEDQLLVHELERPLAPTNTRIDWPAGSQDITIWAYAALGRGESTPYEYSFTATMRTPEPVPWVTSMIRTVASTTNASDVGWTVSFSEAVSGVDTGDFNLIYTGGLSGASNPTTVTQVSPTTWTVTAASGTGQGTLALMLDDDDTIVSAAGLDTNPLGGANPATGPGNGDFVGPSYTIDKVGPSVSVTQDSAQADPTTTTPITFTATFNENVASVNAGMITNTGTAAVPAANISVSGSGTVWAISMTPTTFGTVIPQIGAGAATDPLGNPSSVSTSGADNSVNYQAPAPAAVSITNVQLVNGGGGGGKLAKGDQVVVTFSGPMSLTSFCAGWTGTTISGNQVKVAVENNTTAAGHDKLTVTTTSGCSFKFGVIDLKSNGFVDQERVFQDSGDPSSIAWDSGTNQLRITLGKMTTTGSNPSIPSVQPVYTADGGLQSAAGGSLTSSTFTLSNGPHF